MKKHYPFLLAFVLLTSLSFAQQKSPYTIFDSKGKKVSYKKFIKKIKGNDVVLFGEYHNNPISHWMQIELLKELHQEGAITLGAEMFERDNQEQLNQYLSGEIDAKALDTLARLWPNYKTDYAPIVDYAKANDIPLIATNIPRRFASMVNREGGFEALESLSDEEKSWIAPLPVEFDAELPQYKAMFEMMAGHGGSIDMVKAQAIKDATMAYSILENYSEDQTFLHLHGSFHSDFYEGILWYLQQASPDLAYGTIATVEQEDISKLEEEHLGRADFILCVDSDMTKSY
ncbi:ChaN family lipoprotein [Algoriphagus sediminis]|uniref:ChaN family lipoprotein n=1 Tax=Algoriphagus sediminis TaxID=3057113 RepID=A0ABT7YG11_9BACT|nr:ChaN family lipoprotein [Algoriphagus sediminis]MDN3205275.1 ChaN family lipoprotein [Algoriphagus sediminis]